MRVQRKKQDHCLPISFATVCHDGKCFDFGFSSSAQMMHSFSANYDYAVKAIPGRSRSPAAIGIGIIVREPVQCTLPRTSGSLMAPRVRFGSLFIDLSTKLCASKQAKNTPYTIPLHIHMAHGRRQLDSVLFTELSTRSAQNKYRCTFPAAIFANICYGAVLSWLFCIVEAGGQMNVVYLLASGEGLRKRTLAY